MSWHGWLAVRSNDAVKKKKTLLECDFNCDGRSLGIYSWWDLKRVWCLRLECGK